MHQRASAWYAQHGSPADAIRHALAAADFTRAADLVDLAVPAMSRSRQEATLLGLLATSADLVQFTWRGLAAAKRYLYLADLTQQAQPQVRTEAVIPQTLTDSIRLHNLSYRYPLGQADVLHELNLHLPAGATVAIVGDNGAGKTTLVKLLAGLYQPTAGYLTLDGIDMASLDPDQWRQRIAAGFQDHARFEFLVRETVGIGDLTALLTPDQKAHNRAVSQVRIAIEHAIAGIKRYNILVHRFRNRRTNFHDEVIALCAGLWNFALMY